MKKYIRAKAAKLLEELNKVPLTDTCDDEQFKLIIAALREVNIEMFHNAAERSRKGIAEIKAEAHFQDVKEVEDKIIEEEPKPKIKLSSSILRRVDNS